MIEIDGSFGEGGGQILRTATALAAVLKIPCRVFNIRKGREKPGLQTQHLLGLRALAEICNGRLEGDYLNSTEIKFYPGEIKAKDLTVRIETAGSITLCLQTLLPVALFAKNPIKISFKGGGTDVPFSPTIDHFRYVFLKILEKMGARMEINVIKRGYYPSGGGILEAKVYPSKLKPLVLTEKGGFKKILAISGAAESLKSRKVSERQLMGAREVLNKLKLPMEEMIEYYSTDCPGSQIFIGAFFENTVLGVDELGKLGKRSEDVGKEAAMKLLEEEKSGGCVDRFCADQVLPYMALTGKKCQVKIPWLTPHARTNMWVVEKFFNGKFEVKNNIISWIPK
jgi:RNA 3'-phosphate cyclase